LFFFPSKLMLVLLPILFDYFNVCMPTCNLGITAKTEIAGEPLVYILLVCDLISMVISKDLLVSSITTAHISLPCTM
jgi:hypothetical protein